MSAWLKFMYRDPPRIFTKKQWKEIHRWNRVCARRVIGETRMINITQSYFGACDPYYRKAVEVQAQNVASKVEEEIMGMMSQEDQP